jgi:hypothetical protein
MQGKVAMLRDDDSIKNINELNSASALTQHTLQSNVNCAVKSSAVSKVTQSKILTAQTYGISNTL